MEFSAELRKNGIDCARGIADWLCMIQYPHRDNHPGAGAMPWIISKYGAEYFSNQWNISFAAMGLLAAHKAFGDEKYETAALNACNYLKSLQIFDPFKPQHYGAIREMTPQTSWCYTRDALSAAWTFIEFYRHTGDAEYLERARLWAEWFEKNGRDEENWPLWGIFFENTFKEPLCDMRNDIQGCFQGGGINFFYHLGRETNDKKWSEIVPGLANHFISFVQQPDGFFRSIERSTHKPPEKDPQNGLHRANDDLGTLGLLCAYKQTGNRKYLESIEKFVSAVFTKQLPDGSFEASIAGNPVVINTIYEAGDLINVPGATADAIERALLAIYTRQDKGVINPRMAGGIDEHRKGEVCGRSSCYCLIVLLKLFCCVDNFLTCK